MLVEFSAFEWMQSIAFFACLGYVLGWVADLLLRHNGFGSIGNFFFVLIGAYAAMFIYNLQGFDVNDYPLQALAVAGTGALGLLLITCLFKRVGVF